MSAAKAMIAIHKTLDAQAVAVVHDLVAAASVSGDEAAATGVFVTHARTLGYVVEIDDAGNAHALRYPPKIAANVTPREIVLLGHIDTVPGAIPVAIRDGVLHGRGTVDAKGPLAAFLIAASRASVPDGVVIRVVAAVGEETPHSPGARFLAPRLRPAACIVGEPSGTSGVTLGYKGRLVMHLSLARENAHTAGPAASACDDLVRLWTVCDAMIQSMNAGHEGAFEIVQSSLRSLCSQSDGLDDRASLSAGFRLPRWVTPQQLESRLRDVIAQAESLATVAVRFEGHEHAYATDRNDPVVRALSCAIRAAGERPQPKLKTGTSDLNVVAPVWQCPIAAYGPGDSALDHTPREHLVLADYLRSIAILVGAIESLAGELHATP